MTTTKTYVWNAGCLLLALGLFACSQKTEFSKSSDDGSGNSDDSSGLGGTGGDGDADGDADGDGDGDGDVDTESDTLLTGTEVCEEQGLDIIPRPGRLMLLLDMSDSMHDGAPTKLEQATGALTGLLTNFQGRGIEFGLDMFPDGSDDPNGSDRCGVEAPVTIDCAMNNEQAIIEELQKVHKVGATPLYCAINKFTDPLYAPQYSAVDGNNILVVVSDGMDNCGSGCREASQLISNGAFQDLAESLCADHGIKTVVIGFGADIYPAQLNALAEYGCTQYSEYLPANNQAELQSALEVMAGLAIKCTYIIGKIDNVEVNPDLVNVYFDDEVLLYDTGCSSGTGWRWTSDEHDEIEFCPQACGRIQSGDVSSVTAKFGCKTRRIF